MTYPGIPEAAPRKRRGLIIGLAAAALVVVLGAGAITYVVFFRTSVKQGAITACEDKVRTQLKTPATAKFSGVQADPSDQTQAADGKGWYVTGNLDAQNSFGALVRNTWTCYAFQHGDGSWDARPNVQG
jgi:hypothetical protein